MSTWAIWRTGTTHRGRCGLTRSTCCTFARWLAGEGISLDAVTTEVMLGFLGSCREAATAHRPRSEYSIVDGRNTGYAPATVNRGWRRSRGCSRSGRCASRGQRCRCRAGGKPRRAGSGERTGLLGHLARPKTRSGLRVREPRRLPRGLDGGEVAALVGSMRTWRDRGIAGLMLYSGLRSAEVLGLNVRDVDIGGRWVRVTGKGDKERRVPLDTEVAGVVQAYLLAERPATSSPRLFVVAKGPHRGQPLTPAGLRTVFRYHRQRTGVAAGHPHALRHTFGTAPSLSNPCPLTPPLPSPLPGRGRVDLAVIQALLPGPRSRRLGRRLHSPGARSGPERVPCRRCPAAGR